jgi:hypothetical protein
LSNISGATQAAYQPGNISTWTYFRRAVSDVYFGIVFSDTIHVRPLPYTLIINSNFPVMLGSTLEMTAIPSQPGGTFQWSGPASFSGTGTQVSRSNIQLTHAGIYTVTQSIDNILVRDTINIIVYNALSANTLSGNQTIVTGTQPAQIVGSTPSGGSGRYIYAWESSSNQGQTWSSISGASARSFTPGILSSLTYYRRIVSDSLATGSDVSLPHTISIVNYTISILSNAPIFAGATLQLTALPSQSGGTAAWAGPSSWTGAGFTTNRAAVAVSASGIYTVTQTIDNAQVRATQSLTVYAVLSSNSVTGAQTILSGSTPAMLTGSPITGGSGTYTYLWEQSTNSGSSWSVISGGTQVNYSPPGSETLTRQYRRIVSDNIVPGSFTSATVSVVVVNHTASIVSNAPIYVGTTLAFTATPSRAGGTYSWSGPGVLSSSTTLTPSRTSVTTAWTGIYTFTQSLDNVQIRATQSITIYTALSANTLTGNQTILSGSSPALITGSPISGGSGSYQYQWQQSTNNGTTWSGMPGESGGNLSPGPLSLTTQFRRIVSDAIVSGTFTSAAVTIRVVNYTASVSSNTPLFVGGTLQLSGQVSQAGGTLLWQGPNSVTGNASTLNVPSVSLSAGGIYSFTQTIDNVQVRATHTVSVFSALSANTLSGTQSIISGNPASALIGSVISGGSGNFSYQWQSSSNSGSTWSVVTGASAINYSPAL